MLFNCLMILGFEFQVLPRAEVDLRHFDSKYFHNSTVHRQWQDVMNSKTRAVHRGSSLRVNNSINCHIVQS
jgi:hypothetical protein